jgi:hypothetical protein
VRSIYLCRSSRSGRRSIVFGSSRLLTGWSLVRIRPGEPSNFRGLRDSPKNPDKTKMPLGQHQGQRSASFNGSRLRVLQNAPSLRVSGARALFDIAYGIILSRYGKLIAGIRNNPKDVRFDDACKIAK